MWGVSVPSPCVVCRSTIYWIKCFIGKDIFHFEQFNFKKLAFHSGGNAWKNFIRKMRGERITQNNYVKKSYFVPVWCEELCDCKVGEGEVWCDPDHRESYTHTVVESPGGVWGGCSTSDTDFGKKDEKESQGQNENGQVLQGTYQGRVQSSQRRCSGVNRGCEYIETGTLGRHSDWELVKIRDHFNWKHKKKSLSSYTLQFHFGTSLKVKML